MIVLFCFVGIFVCWVKGYIEGIFDNIFVFVEGVDVYIIKNDNVYFWVEVYFLGYGWILFELIKGFINFYNFINNMFVFIL